mgnify:CR=1 FL=1
MPAAAAPYVVCLRRGAAESVTIIHLPDGPTAHFKLTSVKKHKEIYVRASHRPLARCVR